MDAKGKINKTYPQNQIATPYERLQFIHDFRTHLRLDIDPEGFSQLAIALSDNEAAKQVQEAKRRLFQSFNRRPKIAA
ncbi:MAG: hypothetical protein H7232_08005 [Aeromicrobium sp.]|nr:hypothetical protein [Burkholderiales bacterium]